MNLDFTANVCRTFRAAEQFCRDAIASAESHQHAALSSVHLLAALAEDEEGAAGERLARCGVTRKSVRQRWPGSFGQNDSPDVCETAPLKRSETTAFSRFACYHEESLWEIVPWDEELESCLTYLVDPLATQLEPRLVATDHILYCLACSDSEVGEWLRRQGLASEDILARIMILYGGGQNGANDLPLDMPPELEVNSQAETTTTSSHRCCSSKPSLCGAQDESDCSSQPIQSERNESIISQQRRMLRVIDAAGNRGREGLRVLDDFVRFILDDDCLTERFKSLRHALTESLSVFPLIDRLESRDTRGDVGTKLTAPLEYRRDDPEAVVAANFHRLQESLRSIEEFGKLLRPDVVPKVEQIRYETYSLHKELAPQLKNAFRDVSRSEAKRGRLARLDDARLYLLLDGRDDEVAFSSFARLILAEGVDVVQLRDKRLSDRELLGRARILARIVQDIPSRPLFIMNDRPDLALLAEADGVHVGQDELAALDVRRLLGADMLIGVSTHAVDEALAAVSDGADYIGAGPTFPSNTKTFDLFPGLGLLQDVTDRVAIPVFAIGGIEESNIGDVLSTGAQRIAVSGAVLNATHPGQAARRLSERLRRAGL